MTSPSLYTVIDENGEILYSKITTDPNYPVQLGNRLVLDDTPWVDSTTHLIRRITPVPPGQNFVEYVVTERIIPDNEKAGNIRGKRDELLAKCDWTQLSDNQLSDAKRSEWTVYRQELRDITAQNSFPNTVTWPTKPAE